MIITVNSEKIQIELDCGCQVEEQKNFEPDFASVCGDHESFDGRTLADVLNAAVEKKAPAKT